MLEKKLQPFDLEKTSFKQDEKVVIALLLKGLTDFLSDKDFTHLKSSIASEPFLKDENKTKKLFRQLFSGYRELFAISGFYPKSIVQELDERDNYTKNQIDPLFKLSQLFSGYKNFTKNYGGFDNGEVVEKKAADFLAQYDAPWLVASLLEQFEKKSKPEMRQLLFSLVDRAFLQESLVQYLEKGMEVENPLSAEEAAAVKLFSEILNLDFLLKNRTFQPKIFGKAERAILRELGLESVYALDDLYSKEVKEGHRQYDFERVKEKISRLKKWFKSFSNLESKAVGDKTKDWPQPSPNLRFSVQIPVYNELPLPEDLADYHAQSVSQSGKQAGQKTELTKTYQKARGNIVDTLEAIFQATEELVESGKGTADEVEIVLNVNNKPKKSGGWKWRKS